MQSLEARVAVVTGAASGIGLALAEAMGAAGMRLLMTDLDGDAVRVAASAAADRGVEVDALQLDVRDADAVERAARHAVDRFGALHVAVNNAGIVNRGNSWELSLEEWHRVIDVDLWGVVHGVRSFVPRILDAGAEGHVVNVASMAAVLPQERLGPYTVAKHGVLGLSDVLRAELAAASAPVGVSVVLPGRIRTGMNPVGSVDPAAVAANVLDAMRRQRPYVFTDDHAIDAVEARLHAILAAREEVLAP
ncbi:MAG TPA: SDR family NAD(P)-dependent oxidoreductase [Acidimicrobiales bacterium]|nr:SDR family NAD(P)-dependent oxidoreductase [Acidimicrobiales bacterium]